MSQDWFKGKYPPSVVEAFACCLFLTELGFDPANEFSVKVTEVVTVVLHVDGLPAFNLPVGTPELECNNIKSLLKEISCEDFSDAEIDWVLSTARILKHGASIAHALKYMGFRPIEHAAND